MLPDSLFRPLDLDDALDDAYDEGDDAVTDLLESALTDPRARGDGRVLEYVEPLIEACRAAGRERDAIDVLHQIAERNPELAGVLTMSIVVLHAELDEHPVAATLLRQHHAQERSRPATERDLRFCASAAMLAAGLLHDKDLARALVSDGLSLASERDDAETMLLLQALHARLDPVESDPAGHDPGAAPHRYAGSAARPPRQQRLRYRMAYLPAPQYAAARARHLLDATMYPRHEDYRRELQESLEKITAANPGATACVVPLDVEGLLAYAEREGKDPASRQTRLAYNDSLQEAGRDISWPPARNTPCWCGSARKYKKCCGAPGFTAAVVPDPASLVLKIKLDHVEPPVWRRVAAPSNLPLDHVHRLIQSAMGWHDEHLYQFDNDEISVSDPRSTDPGYPAEEERLVSIAAEPGEQFTYTYDFGDGWTHTVTLEEIREAGPDNKPEILDGAGACPPENCGGPAGYLALLRALQDPADPNHDEAVDRLGEGFDPTAYEAPIRAW